MFFLKNSFQSELSLGFSFCLIHKWTLQTEQSEIFHFKQEAHKGILETSVRGKAQILS